jgi:DNA primase
MNLLEELSKVDILSIVGKDTRLKRVANTEGGEYAGPCPRCGGEDRFRVWPNHSCGKGRFWCFQCAESGDALDYLMWTGRISSYQKGARLLGLHVNLDPPAGSGSPQLMPRHRGPSTPPPAAWQQTVGHFVERSFQNLWWACGKQTLEWLQGRGLSAKTIREARLGYNPSQDFESWTASGIHPCDGSRAVLLPRGVVIPWEIEGSLWRVGIGRPVTQEQGGARYTLVTGSRNALYNADALLVNRPAILVEGVFDALTIKQQAGDMIAAVATGGRPSSRQPLRIARLALCSQVLVAFDADEAGDHEAGYWLGVLDNAKRWRPYWGDVNAMAHDGVNIREWIAAGLDRCDSGHGADAVETH